MTAAALEARLRVALPPLKPALPERYLQDPTAALVAADDIHLFPEALKPYLDYVREPANGYVSVTFPVGDALEVSARAR